MLNDVHVDGMVNIDTLENSDSPEMEYVIDILIPAEGLTVLAGKSGVGKSTLLYSMLYAMLTGEKALGRLDTMATSVLVFTEDDERVLTPYLQRISANWPKRRVEGADINFVPRVSGMTELEDVATKVAPGLIVIDPILHIGGLSDGSNDNQVNDYLNRLYRLSSVLRCGIVFTRHFRKKDDKVEYNEYNVYDQITGSYAWKSTPYNRVVMWRDSNHAYRLSCESKFAAEVHWELDFDREAGQLVLPSSNDVRKRRRKVSKWRDPILTAAENAKDGKFGAKAMELTLRKIYGFDNVSRDAIRKEMANMADDGLLIAEETPSGHVYQYCVGIGQAIMHDLEYKRYPSPVDLADEAAPGDDMRHVEFN